MNNVCVSFFPIRLSSGPDVEQRLGGFDYDRRYKPFEVHCNVCNKRGCFSQSHSDEECELAKYSRSKIGSLNTRDRAIWDSRWLEVFENPNKALDGSSNE